MACDIIFGFFADLLLLKNQEGLAEIRVALLQFLFEHRNLRVLAAEAEDGGAGNVRVVDVAGEDARQVATVFASAAAAAFVPQKFYSVDISKQFWSVCAGLRRELDIFQLGRLAFAIETNEFGNLAAIDLRESEAEFFLEGLFQDGEVAVFAEDERNDQPMIAGADLSIAAVIAEEAAILPFGNVRCMPLGASGAGVEIGGRVTNVARRKEIAAMNRLGGGADEKTVHANFVARLHVASEKFVFRRNVGKECVGLTGKTDLLAFAEGRECDDHVVLGVQLEDVGWHDLIIGLPAWAHTIGAAAAGRRCKLLPSHSTGHGDYRQRAGNCQTREAPLPLFFVSADSKGL